MEWKVVLLDNIVVHREQEGKEGVSGDELTVCRGQIAWPLQIIALLFSVFSAMRISRK